ncbi:hypothetical protein JAAARDRAFT_81685 [Jaapia argillacea MUCL 33604]|uniref:MYND-type domain-containing protein n=1 Tax=Jaapia argillacea MUCL 33604 TaxID=933084 RepID=A0A067PK76_9AGAM|nr:hypothetical protein JAAARDRAFT_81685 [Jaapia argillacea MUCL 33604]
MDQNAALNDPRVQAVLGRLEARPYLQGNDLPRKNAKARLKCAYMGSYMKDLFATHPKPAPLLNPPIVTGMADALNRLHSVLMKYGDVTREEFKEVPGLLRRLRELLRVYYDSIFTGHNPASYRFCDVQSISEVGLTLHEIGLYLQFNPIRLRQLMAYAGLEMDTFLLDDPIDVGEWRQVADARTRQVDADPEADDDDRMALAELDQKSQKDQAGYQMMFFIADVLVALFFHPKLDRKDKERSKKALARIVEWSTVGMYRDAFGDALTDAMIDVYKSQKHLVEFGQAGGLGALIGDWAESNYKNSWCKEAVETLPDAAWNRQTDASLDSVMRGLLLKQEHDGDEIFQTLTVARMFHNIYIRYGLKPFERASKFSPLDIIFYFLFRRAAKRKQKLQTVEDWVALLNKYREVPRATRTRHSWILMSVSTRWDFVSMDVDQGYGCRSPACPTRAELVELKARRVRGIRNHDVEEKLYKFGGTPSACKNCRHVAYCGKECQAADWRRHREECRTEGAKGHNEDV